MLHLRKLEIRWFVVLLALAILRCWSASPMVWRADGNYYLDIAFAWQRGDWWNAFDLIYSSGYPIILLIWMKLIHPSMLHLTQWIQVLQVVLFLFTFVSFRYFLHSLFHCVTRNAGEFGSPEILTSISNFAWFTFGVTAEMWVGANTIGPDLIVFGMCLINAGLVMRLYDSKN